MNFSKQERIILIVLSTLLVASIGFFLFKTWVSTGPEETNLPKPMATYVVQIAGEVIRPGVYQVEEGTRLYQLVDLAGGSTPKADLSGLNLAAPVQDGLRINVPTLPDPNTGSFESTSLSLLEEALVTINPSGGSDPNQLINVNTASQEELKKLIGIGDVIAQRIIEYRQTHGPFRSGDDLLGVKGIGTKKLENIKDSISF